MVFQGFEASMVQVKLAEASYWGMAIIGSWGGMPAGV
jgi:hypothetical protein